MEINKQVEFNLNFGGFYESIHSYMIDNSIADFYDKDIDDIYEDDKIYNEIDFKASPEYYNFETDKINASINEFAIDNIIKNANHDLIEYINENSQSYDGFHSHYIGFNEVIKNKAVFMTYYTDYLTELNKDKIKYIYEDIFIDVEFNLISNNKYIWKGGE